MNGRVLRVLAPNPSLETGAGTNTYLIGAGGCLIVDPGPAVPAHLERVARLAERRGGVRAILITHAHPDHLAGAAQLRQMTGAPLFTQSQAHVPEADHLLADQDAVEAGTTRLIALHTPGHSADHLCFHDPVRQILFAGDLVAGEGTVFIAPPDGDLAAYLASLQRMLALPLRRIFPGHGPTVRSPHALLRAYLAHRAARERQVLAALDAGVRDMDGLIESVYPGLEHGRRPLAALQLRALLRKLADEGRVDRTLEGHRVPSG